MLKLALLASILLSIGTAAASNFDVLGNPAEPGLVLGVERDECTGDLIYSHDDSFESGLTFWYGRVHSMSIGYVVESFGIGYYWSGTTPAESVTWGSIKGLFD